MNNIKILGQCDENTNKQIDEIIKNNPFLKKSKIVIMEDAHKGQGVPIGFTAILPKNNLWVNPEIISNDIGCGITIYKLHNFQPQTNKFYETTWKSLDRIVRGYQMDVQKRFGLLTYDHLKIKHNYPSWLNDDSQQHVENTFGTIGNGNHFLELLKDSDNNYYLAMHSGSRALGTKINDYWIRKAKYQQHTFIKKLIINTSEQLRQKK